VRGEGAEWVLAEQARLDVDAREAIAMGDEPGDFFVAQPGADRQRSNSALLPQLVLGCLETATDLQWRDLSV
jgi:hypothetical protein